MCIKVLAVIFKVILTDNLENLAFTEVSSQIKLVY